MVNYCSVETSPKTDFRRVFADVTKGDAEATDFCWAFLGWVHFIDDVADGEVAAKWTLPQIVDVNLHAALTFAGNPFFRKYRHALWPLILSAARAWVDSEDERHDRRMRDVLKTQYQEVFWHVAFLVGGWEHQAVVTALHRECPP